MKSEACIAHGKEDAINNILPSCPGVDSLFLLVGEMFGKRIPTGNCSQGHRRDRDRLLMLPPHSFPLLQGLRPSVR